MSTIVTENYNIHLLAFYSDLNLARFLGSCKTKFLTSIPFDFNSLFEIRNIYHWGDGNMDGNTNRLFYLMQQDRKLFVGKLIPGAAIVHNVELQDTQRKFEIISLIDAEKWENFDKDRHTIGTFIA